MSVNEEKPTSISTKTDTTYLTKGLFETTIAKYTLHLKVILVDSKSFEKDLTFNNSSREALIQTYKRLLRERWLRCLQEEYQIHLT